MTIKATVDDSSALAGLDMLGGALRVSLARSMAVAGGQMIRDEAKVRAPEDSGRLKSAIYLAYKDGESTDERVVYSITWNSRTAPHGHLIEFGHWQTNVAYKDGADWWSGQAKQPKWISAHPFLRPAYEATGERAQAAMFERARERLPELLAEIPK